MSWKTKGLGDLCHVYQPQTLGKKDFVSGPYPVFGANGQIGWHNQFNHPDEELVIGCRGSVGFVHRTPKKAWINGNAMVVKAGDEVSVDYLAYALSGGIDISSAVSGTAQPQITRQSLAPLLLPYPSDLAEQQRIVAILDEAFAGIAVAKANAEATLTAIQELQSQSVNAILSRGNWPKKRMSELFDIGSSKRVLKSQWTSAGVPFYRGREITRLSMHGVVANELFITEELYREFAEKHGVPKVGDIMITAIGTIGNPFVVRAHDKFYFKDASVLWLAKKSDVDSDYMNDWIKSPRFSAQLDVGNGATVDTLTIGKLQSMLIDLPPTDIQRDIAANILELKGVATHLQSLTTRKLAALDELKQSLLQRAFSGQL